MKDKQMLEVIMNEIHEDLSKIRSDFAGLISSFINGGDTHIGYKIVAILDGIAKLDDQLTKAQQDIGEIK